MKLIVITGTPGTGKSTLAKWLAKKLNFYRLDLSKYYQQISVRYNQKKQCYDIDLRKFEQLVRKMLEEKENLIVDSHIAHLLPRKMVQLCIVITCSNLKKLIKLLEKRNYSHKKIRENIDAEIFQLCLIGAQNKKHRIITFDTSKKITQKGILTKVKSVVGC